MQFVCIGVNECAEDIIKCISNELQQVNDSKIGYAIDKVNSDGSTSIVCRIDDNGALDKVPQEAYNELILHVSGALADYIIKQYEEKLLGRTINSNYCYFNSAEKKEILNLAVRIIRNEDKNLLNSLFQLRRRNIIIKKLMDYFESSNTLVLDGFVNFRLKEYVKDLEDVVDKAVDDFLMEREYREFITLLRYFVEIQEPKFNVVHVISGFDNRYVLLDENHKEITNECIQEFVSEISEGEINYDDLLVSSLITLAPRKIVIHTLGQFRNKELLETIKNVFFGKVLICSGCNVCMMSVAQSETKK